MPADASNGPAGTRLPSRRVLTPLRPNQRATDVELIIVRTRHRPAPGSLPEQGPRTYGELRLPTDLSVAARNETRRDCRDRGMTQIHDRTRDVGKLDGGGG